MAKDDGVHLNNFWYLSWPLFRSGHPKSGLFFTDETLTHHSNNKTSGILFFFQREKMPASILQISQFFFLSGESMGAITHIIDLATGVQTTKLGGQAKYESITEIETFFPFFIKKMEPGDESGSKRKMKC